MTALLQTLKIAPATQFAALRSAFALFGVRGWSFALLGAVVTLFLI